jgi:hypothetical protein
LDCRQAFKPRSRSASGLVKLGQVAIDGTRNKANASKHKAMSYRRMTQQEAALQAEIVELLRRAEQADRDEDARYGADRRGDELPLELARRDSRLQKIRDAKAALEAEARERSRRARVGRIRLRPRSPRRPSATSRIRSRRSRRPPTASFRVTMPTRRSTATPR